MKLLIALCFTVISISACTAGTCEPPKKEGHTCGTTSDCTCSGGTGGASCGSEDSSCACGK